MRFARQCRRRRSGRWRDREESGRSRMPPFESPPANRVRWLSGPDRWKQFFSYIPFLKAFHRRSRAKARLRPRRADPTSAASEVTHFEKSIVPTRSWTRAIFSFSRNASVPRRCAGRRRIPEARRADLDCARARDQKLGGIHTRAMPPRPITGIFTACAASYTIRSAIGLIAGPERPPNLLPSRGFRVCASIARATKVLTREIASAPGVRRDPRQRLDTGYVGRELHDQRPLGDAAGGRHDLRRAARDRSRKTCRREPYWGRTRSVRRRRSLRSSSARSTSDVILHA